MIKKLLSAVLSAAMIFSAVTFTPAEKNIVQTETAVAAASDFTADQAIEWCKSTVGITVDNGQCVGFINGYMDYLGVNHYNYLVEVAADFRYERFCPPGWQQIEGAQPQKGDILIYTGGVIWNGKYCGHVAIYESDSSLYEQNYDNKQYVVHNTYNYRTSGYWGVLRPNFKSPEVHGHVMTDAEGAGQTIPDGDYWIYSALHPWYYLDIPGTEIITENGVQLNMWRDPQNDDGTYNNPAVTDVWTIQYRGDGFYKIKQKGSDMCLDVRGDSTKMGATVQLYKDTGAYSQRWSIVPTSLGFKLQAKCDGFNLDVNYGKIESGTKLFMWEDQAEEEKQRFCFVPYDSDDRPLSDGNYNIRSVIAPEYYLDVAGKNEEHKSGTNIQIWKGVQDNFKIKYAGDGWYEMYDESSELALTVDPYDSCTKNTTNIMLYEDSAYRRQMWRFVPTADGHYYIINKLSGYYMDLEYGKGENGNNVSQHTYNGGNAQKWDIIPVTTAPPVTTTKKPTTTTTKTTTKTTAATTTTKPATTTTAPALSVGVKELTLYTGDQFTLKPNQSDVTFKSSNTDSAIVSKSGVITAIAPGEAVITVINADSDAVTVKVKVVNTIRGDANKDGSVNVADLVMLQKWLSAASKDMTNAQNADINGDGRLDAFDLVLLRKLVIAKK